MKKPGLLLLSVLAMAICPLLPMAMGEEKKAAPGTLALAQGTLTLGPVVSPMTKVIESVEFNDILLDDVIQFIEQTAPGFKAVIKRGQGVSEEYPRIKMKLKNVTVGQLCELIKKLHADVTFDVLENTEEPIFIIRVEASPESAGSATPNLKLYNLSTMLQTIRESNKSKEVTAKPLDHLLSLIKATMQQRNDKKPPVLQVHEETNTMIFKGSAAQQLALEEVLLSLKPAKIDESVIVARLKAQTDSMQNELMKQQDTYKEKRAIMEDEFITLRKRLEASQSETMKLALEVEKLTLQIQMRAENQKIINDEKSRK